MKGWSKDHPKLFKQHDSELLRESNAALWIDYRDKDLVTALKHYMHGVRLKATTAFTTKAKGDIMKKREGKGVTPVTVGIETDASLKGFRSIGELRRCVHRAGSYWRDDTLPF